MIQVRWMEGVAKERKTKNTKKNAKKRKKIRKRVKKKIGKDQGKIENCNEKNIHYFNAKCKIELHD